MVRSAPTRGQRQSHRATDATGAEQQGVPDTVRAEPFDGLDRGRHVRVVADQAVAITHDGVDGIRFPGDVADLVHQRRHGGLVRHCHVGAPDVVRAKALDGSGDLVPGHVLEDVVMGQVERLECGRHHGR